nr:uncharacterized protein LOC105846427 [Hydra vulgaris]
MPQPFGFIDGTHIPIRRPLESSQDYFNYKGFHSISVQANCDSKRMISNSIPITYRELLPGFCKVPCYVIGDPGYPLSTFCLKEYLHCQNNNQVVFNTSLRTARNQKECAFGRLKAQWIKCITVDEEVFINNIKENINSDKVDYIYSCNTDEGSLIREVITQYISGCNNNSI